MNILWNCVWDLTKPCFNMNNKDQMDCASECGMCWLAIGYRSFLDHLWYLHELIYIAIQATEISYDHHAL